VAELAKKTAGLYANGREFVPNSRQSPRARSLQSLLNLSFTLHGRTTRATGGTMREFIPGSVRCPWGCWAEPPILCPRNVLALASGPNRPQLFLI